MQKYQSDIHYHLENTLLVPQAIILPDKSLKRKKKSFLIINMHYQHATLFTPRNKSKSRALGEAFQWVSINLRLFVHSQRFPPSQLVVWARMMEKNMAFSHNSPFSRRVQSHVIKTIKQLCHLWSSAAAESKGRKQEDRRVKWRQNTERMNNYTKQ